jgi:hypothetical protein
MGVGRGTRTDRVCGVGGAGNQRRPATGWTKSFEGVNPEHDR